jgi:hypothetical protein
MAISAKIPDEQGGVVLKNNDKKADLSRTLHASNSINNISCNSISLPGSDGLPVISAQARATDLENDHHCQRVMNLWNARLA